MPFRAIYCISREVFWHRINLRSQSQHPRLQAGLILVHPATKCRSICSTPTLYSSRSRRFSRRNESTTLRDIFRSFANQYGLFQDEPTHRLHEGPSNDTPTPSKISKPLDKPNLGLDPQTAFSGLKIKKKSDVDIQRLLNFMSDDNVFPPHPNWKPSTRDRVKESGERVYKEDLEIETLFMFSKSLESSTKSNSTEHELEQSDIDALDKTLKSSQTAQQRYDDEHFRLEKSLKYSNAVFNSANPRLIERGNFFTPVYRDVPWGARNKESSDLAKEYVILTPNQRVTYSSNKPFNQEATPATVYKILSELPNPTKYIRTIAKLEKQGWYVVGGGGPGNLIIFEREYNRKRRSTDYAIKLLVGLTGSIATLVALFTLIGRPKKPSSTPVPNNHDRYDASSHSWYANTLDFHFMLFMIRTLRIKPFSFSFSFSFLGILFKFIKPVYSSYISVSVAFFVGFSSTLIILICASPPLLPSHLSKACTLSSSVISGTSTRLVHVSKCECLQKETYCIQF